MTDYKNLTVRELDEAVSLGALDLVYLLVEAGINRDKFRESLDKLNAATAELTFRAENYNDPQGAMRAEINLLKEVLRELGERVDSVLNDRGGEETSDQ